MTGGAAGAGAVVIGIAAAIIGTGIHRLALAARPHVERRLLIACRGLAYGVSLSGFRGGPTFPGIYIGAAGGIAMSHLPGLPMVAGLAMGIGAMSVVMLGLPLTSVLLATLLVLSDGSTSCRW